LVTAWRWCGQFVGNHILWLHPVQCRLGVISWSSIYLEKNIIHILMLCSQANDIWIDWRFHVVQSMCHNVGLNNVSYIIMTLVDEKVILALLIMWNIWISRNNFIFEGTLTKRYKIMLATFAQPHVALHAFRSSSSPRCLVREVGWKKRDHVTMVLNMDNNALAD